MLFVKECTDYNWPSYPT